MTASVGGGNAAHSPTHTPIKRDIHELLKWRAHYSEQLEAGHGDRDLTEMALASLGAEIVRWLVTHVPGAILGAAATTASSPDSTQYNPDVVSHPSENIRAT